MKNIISILIILFMPSQIFAQPATSAEGNDTMSIFINAKKVAQYILKTNQTEADFIIKKIALNKIKTITLQIKGQHVTDAKYARNLQISGDNTINITEAKSKPGYFDISKTDVKKRLAAGKIIPLHLVMNPANPMMLFPSKIIFLGNLMMK